MRITQEADYAIRIICMLAELKDKADANKIAQQTMITQRFALKILRKLVGVDIIKSFKGVTGGYMLSKEPNEITLRAIIETIDGPVQIMKCIDKDHCCSQMGLDKSKCVLHNIFASISNNIVNILDKITVEMIINNDADIFCILECK